MIVAQGQLSDRPLPRTFAAIAARSFTGEFVVDPGPREHRIGWRDGAIVSAHSPHPADSAAKIAVTLGILNSTQAGDVTRTVLANPGCDDVDVVARTARLSSDAVGRLARRLVATRAARVFALESAGFALDDTPPLAAVPPIDARWILYSGVRAHYPIDRLHREVAAWASAIQLATDADLAAYGFGEAEADALARLSQGPLTLAPVASDLDARVVEAIALVLLATGGAIAVAANAEPARGPGARSPAGAARTTDRGATTSAPERSAGRKGTTPPPSSTGRITTAPATAATNPGGERPSSRAITSAPAGDAAPRVARASSQPGLPRPRTATPDRAATGPGTASSRVRTPRTRTIDPGRAAVLIAERRALIDGGADHFTLLGIGPDAAIEEVRAAYFELARHLHPDRLAAAGVVDDRRTAHLVFARINEAFAILSDPDRRLEYVRVQRAGGTAAVAASVEQASATVRQVMGGEEAYRKGESALRRMQFDEAIQHFEKSIELSPNEADHHAMLAWTTYVAAPDKAAAMSLVRVRLRKATELTDKSALPHLVLGRIARMEGNAEEAIKHLQRALDLAPRNGEAAAELRAAESMRGRSRSPSLFSKLKKS